ncbi:MAG: transglutaminase [Betaproteobacteria bacterium]|nr:transglutaminase [Betaproteobacteria bacterium]
MSFSLPVRAPSVLDYFATLVRADEGLPLLEAAACIAQDTSPGLDVQAVLAEVDALLSRLKRKLPADAAGMHKLRVLNAFFFGELGFGGNVNDYYAPANSYLNEVLRTRRGIPISLSVLWLELARGLSLQADGVGFPGHFMVKVRLPQGQVVLDPFTGESQSPEQLSERIAAFRPDGAWREETEVPLALYLQPASAREMLARMLRNLREIHRSSNDMAMWFAVQDRLIVLLPQAWAEYRERGLMHASQGRLAQAVQDVQTYLAQHPRAPDAATLQEQLARWRSG